MASAAVESESCGHIAMAAAIGWRLPSWLRGDHKIAPAPARVRPSDALRAPPSRESSLPFLAGGARMASVGKSSIVMRRPLLIGLRAVRHNQNVPQLLHFWQVCWVFAGSLSAMVGWPRIVSSLAGQRSSPAGEARARSTCPVSQSAVVSSEACSVSAQAAWLMSRCLPSHVRTSRPGLLWQAQDGSLLQLPGDSHEVMLSTSLGPPSSCPRLSSVRGLEATRAAAV